MKEKPFAAFDIDGTIFRSSLLIEVVEEAIRKGVFTAEAKSLYAQQYQDWLDRKHRESYDTYILAVVEAFERYIKGVTAKQFQSVAESVIAELQKRTYVYTTQMIKQLKSKGYFLIAVSGSPEELVKQFAQIYDFDYIFATRYHVRDGKYDGSATKVHTGKDKVLKEIINTFDLTHPGSIAVGDSGGDRGLLELAEHPIAFNPDRRLFRLAKVNGWKVVIERKNVIYQLEPKNGGFVLAQAD